MLRGRHAHASEEAALHADKRLQQADAALQAGQKDAPLLITFAAWREAMLA
eukprot:CAMPEP_0195087176 /NCGR_PEP_ID=MMETSP0448-20130528/27098_1 /TAXON_ID=66468 /ORGANISM="Heterocapsa triquestra, Strain CCMP 448" /LENGTH=50 /DNA_ID=CAMNT_0040120717 /DNA_START=1 /DNA_END=150 /DNA_ORIENTATION=+